MHALIIFVRNPEPGKVKTRLAATLGDEKALHIYKDLLHHTRSVSRQSTAHKFVFYHNEIDWDDEWNEPDFNKRLQCNTNLGGKMRRAFKEVFSAGYDKAIIIGSDCFELTTALIESAFLYLDDKDVVIGPASDGGYYLLGMKRMHSCFFSNKQWSTASVYAATLQDAATHGLSITSLPVLTDVDTEADWLLTKK